MAAADFYGAESKIPGSNTTWLQLAEKTFWEVSTKGQMDKTCGGGIFWVSFLFIYIVDNTLPAVNMTQPPSFARIY